MGVRTTRVAGAIGAVGGVLGIVTNVPSGWYGVRPTDSYVFDPAVLSPLWVAREVVPGLSMVAAFGLVVGLAGLLARDWQTYERYRRWSGVAGLVGLACLALAISLFVGGAGNTTASSAIAVLAAIVVGGVGVLLFVPGTVLLGIGYLRAGERPIGSGLVLSVVAVPVLGYLSPGSVRALLAVAPMGVTWVLVGHDLWTAPTAEPADTPTPDERPSDADETGPSGEAADADENGGANPDPPDRD
ncbi:MAG: hypothetical protein ABEJ67_00830 [Halanaeroarchaeum sp.]